jgi:hypothetical protein
MYAGIVSQHAGINAEVLIKIVDQRRHFQECVLTMDNISWLFETDLIEGYNKVN